MAFSWKHIEVVAEMLSTRGPVWRIIGGLIRSRYFMASAGFYLLILLIIGGYQISEYAALKGTFEDGEQLLVLPPPIPPPPPPKTTQEKATTKEVQVSTAASSIEKAVTRIAVSAPSTFQRAIEAPTVAPSLSMGNIKIETPLAHRIQQAEIARLVKARTFQKSWNVQGSKKATKAKFTIFKAKYKDGDWNCNPKDLENLMLQIRRWSRDRLEAELHPEVLDVGTDRLFEIKPPFVYLTGHKNFTLLDKEVENLRDYLMLSGAIWADSALAGRRSRFDMAFRREMKRVLPDREFEVVPDEHDMFDTFFDRIRLPPGINFYHEPAEMISIGDLLAVLYTLNGYGHFWETRLDAQNKIEWRRIKVGVHPKTKRPVWSHVYGPHLMRNTTARILYRNIDDSTVEANYKFGINVVVHLLTRYQEKFRHLPIELPEASQTGPRRDKKAPVDEVETKEEKPAAKPKAKPVHKKLETPTSLQGGTLPTVGALPTVGKKTESDEEKK